jgi:diacylglycerol O-acyltransferase
VTLDTGRSLQEYVAGEISRPLDRDRPLWELHAIDTGGPGGRRNGEAGASALLLRTHHAIGDGAALMHVIGRLTDPVDGGVPPAGEGARPGRATPLHERLRINPAMVSRLVAGLPSSAAVLGGALSGTKAVRWSATAALDDLRRAGAPHGATVNDVGLAAAGGALARHLPGEALDDVQACVPVSVRPAGGMPGELGNQFGLAFVSLPVTGGGPSGRGSGKDDAGDRIARAHKATDLVKASNEAQFVFDVMTFVGRTPEAYARGWVDAFARRASLVLTNIRGPAAPVAIAGVPVEGMVLLVPATGPIGLGVSLCSYAGTVRFGIVADDAVVADPGRLDGDVVAALAEVTAA